MKKIRRLFIPVFIIVAAFPCSAHQPQSAHTKSEIKQGAKEVAGGAKEAWKGIKKGGKAVGHKTRDVAKTIGHDTRQGARDVKKEVKK